jgi:hypothetical protein
MKRIFLKQPQNPIKIEVLYSLKHNGGNVIMKSKFKNLIEDYAFHGRKIEELDKERLFALILAYLEDKFSGFSGGSCPEQIIDVPMTIEMLHKLNSNIYNHQRALLEDIKKVVVATQINKVDEKLDEEKEKVSQILGDGYYRYRDRIVILLSAMKKQEVSYAR